MAAVIKTAHPQVSEHVIAGLRASAPQLERHMQTLFDLARVETIDGWLRGETVEDREASHHAYRAIDSVEQIFAAILREAQSRED